MSESPDLYVVAKYLEEPLSLLVKITLYPSAEGHAAARLIFMYSESYCNQPLNSAS